MFGALAVATLIIAAFDPLTRHAFGDRFVGAVAYNSLNRGGDLDVHRRRRCGRVADRLPTSGAAHLLRGPGWRLADRHARRHDLPLPPDRDLPAVAGRTAAPVRHSPDDRDRVPRRPVPRGLPLSAVWTDPIAAGPMIKKPLPVEFWITTGTAALGTLWYLGVKAYRRRQGIDIRLAFQQIPIE